MIKVSIIVAVGNNLEIGKDNQMLWHLPNELKYFKNTTWGMPIVMGRKTFESLGKTLPGRENIVITGQRDWNAAGIVAVHSIDEAIQAAKKTDATELFVIGGGKIYEQTLPLAQTLYITRVQGSFEATVFFPEWNEDAFELIKEKHFETDEKHAYPYTFQVWERKPLN
jgi:dihydrofolate reductase